MHREGQQIIQLLLYVLDLCMAKSLYNLSTASKTKMRRSKRKKKMVSYHMKSSFSCAAEAVFHSQLHMSAMNERGLHCCDSHTQFIRIWRVVGLFGGHPKARSHFVSSHVNQLGQRLRLFLTQSPKEHMREKKFIDTTSFCNWWCSRFPSCSNEMVGSLKTPPVQWL